MKGRRINEFSHKDRVPVRLLKPGDVFIWRGSKHVFTKIEPPLKPLTKVLVSRKSGIAARDYID